MKAVYSPMAPSVCVVTATFVSSDFHAI